MQDLNERLKDDARLRDRLATAIDEYRQTRDAHEVLEPRPAPPGGGPDRVKCLHAHVAHHLASSNPVGALVLAEVGFPDCRRPCVEVA